MPGEALRGEGAENRCVRKVVGVDLEIAPGSGKIAGGEAHGVQVLTPSVTMVLWLSR